MPMKCRRCGAIWPDHATECGGCGGEVIFSLLAEEEANEAHANETAEIVGHPTIGGRILQVLLSVLASQLFAGFFVLAFFFVMAASDLHLADYFKKHPEISFGLLSFMVLMASAASIFLVLRGVYLAQLVGAVTGLLSCVAFLFEKGHPLLKSAGLTPFWLEWAILPPLGLLVGFLAGLGVAGELVLHRKIKFKSVDAWNDDVTPEVRERPAKPGALWVRQIIGLVSGMSILAFVALIWTMVPLLFDILGLQVDFPENPWMIATLLAVVVAGLMAGARTQSGIFQGLVMSGILLGLGYLRHWPLFGSPNDPIYLTAIVTASAMIGRQVLGPTRYFEAPASVTNEKPKPAQTTTS